MIFYTRSCMHLADSIPLQQGKVTVSEFEDGELSIQVEEDVQGKWVWVCASTPAPASTIMETLFLIDALKRAGAYVKLLFVYFGYARQDKVYIGRSLSKEVLYRCLQQFDLHQVHIFHMHNPRACTYLPLFNHIPWTFFFECAQDVDYIVAPDEGALVLAQEISRQSNKPYTVVKKERIDQQNIKIHTTFGNVAGKKILIVDDMIATGSTVVAVSNVLHAHGAARVDVAVTHGLFSGAAYAHIAESPIQKVFVTNSLAQRQVHAKVTVINCGPFLEAIMQ